METENYKQKLIAQLKILRKTYEKDIMTSLVLEDLIQDIENNQIENICEIYSVQEDKLNEFVENYVPNRTTNSLFQANNFLSDTFRSNLKGLDSNIMTLQDFPKEKIEEYKKEIDKISAKYGLDKIDSSITASVSPQQFAQIQKQSENISCLEELKQQITKDMAQSDSLQETLTHEENFKSMLFILDEKIKELRRIN